MCEAVEYLGHRIDSRGLHTLDNKVTAVLEAPCPKDLSELRSFLGLIHYYGKFMPNLSTLLHPLNKLLKAAACEVAFKETKQLLASAPVLANYNPSLPICLAGDASAYGIGEVISHILPDGMERPVVYTSCTLSSTERNYSQLEIPVWTSICLSYGPQTSDYHIRAQERDTTFSCCKTTTLGIYTFCLFIHHSVQTYCRTRQCRQAFQITTRKTPHRFCGQYNSIYHWTNTSITSHR